MSINTSERSVRVRPGGTGAVALSVVVWLCALVFVGGITMVIRAGSGAVVGLILLTPSAMVLCASIYLAQRVTSGFVVDVTGIRGAARSPRHLPWARLAGLRWARTRWWGRGNHQLVADLTDGRTVIVWGVRSARQHDRLVTGLRRADEIGLIPPTVRRAALLYQPWGAVTATLR